MPKFPVVSGKRILEILLKHFGCTRQPQNGSHVPVTRRTPEGEFHSAVPLHKELKTGTIYGILRDLHITPRDFVNYV